MENRLGLSVVIGAAEVVSAISADQFAVVASEAMATVRANLAVMVDGQPLFSGARHTTL